MAQGARVSGNLLHDNADQDLFMEVDHGPYVIDNNIFLSRQAQLIISQGGAYAHNLIAGNLRLIPFDARLTPLHKAHSTELAGLHNNGSGDMRYYNNLFMRSGDISPYDKATLPMALDGNVFLKGAKPCNREVAPMVRPDFDPQLKLEETADGFYLELALDKAWGEGKARKTVTTELLGRASIPDLPFENPDGSPLRIDGDYFGRKRTADNPFPGPFELREGGQQRLKVWPIGEGK
jgi:alpha-L-arabinofuranosidase